jgi:hypothetical protein
MLVRSITRSTFTRCQNINTFKENKVEEMKFPTLIFPFVPQNLTSTNYSSHTPLFASGCTSRRLNLNERKEKKKAPPFPSAQAQQARK